MENSQVKMDEDFSDLVVKLMKRMEYCSVLGVSANATDEDITQAYRRLQMVNHPDKGGKVEKCQLINEAYAFLKNAESCSHVAPNSPPSDEDDETDDDSIKFFFKSNTTSESESETTSQDEDTEKPEIVQQIREEITRARQEVNTFSLADNYFNCYANIFEEILKKNPEDTQRESAVFCKLCDKTFTNQDHHYRSQSIQHYIELFNTESQMEFFFLLKTKLGSDAWTWTPIVLHPDQEIMNNVEKFEAIKARVQDLLQLLQDGTENFELLNDDESLDLKPSFPQQTYRYQASIDIQSFELKEGHENGFSFPNGHLVEIKQSSLPEIVPCELLPRIKIFNGKPKTASTRIKSKCHNCLKKYNTLTKLYCCRMCNRIHCKKCQVTSVVLQLGYSSQVKICQHCAEKSKLENAQLWATAAKDLLSKNNYHYCKLFLEVSFSYLKNNFHNVQQWKEISEMAYEKKQYELFLQIQENLYRNNPTGLVGTAKTLAAVSETNLAAACLADLEFEKEVWIKTAMEFADLKSYSVAAFCISKATLEEEESLQKCEEIMKNSGGLKWKIAFLLLYKPDRNATAWMTLAENLLQKNQIKLAYESFRHLNSDRLTELCNRLGERKEWEHAIMCLLYLAQRYHLKSIQTETATLQYLLWAINDTNPDTLLQKVNSEIAKENYSDAFTVLSFLQFKWKLHNLWRKQSETALNRQNVDLAVIMGIFHHKENTTNDGWLLKLGIKLQHFPDKAYTCFLFGNHTWEYIAEIFKDKGDHAKCIEYYLKAKNLAKIRSIGKNLLYIKPDAAALYYSTIVKFLKGHTDFSYKTENLLCIADELFPHPDERKAVYKSFARTFPEVIAEEKGIKIHLMLIQEIKADILPQDDLKAAELLQAAYHFLPLQLREIAFSRNMKQNALKIKMKIAAEDYDFNTLGKTISHLTIKNASIAEEIYRGLLGTKKIEEVTSTKKAVLFIIRGAILKINEDNLNALNHFLVAAASSEHCLEEVSKCIATILHDFDFNEKIIKEIYAEIDRLGNQMKRKSSICLPYKMFSSGLDRSFHDGINISLQESCENILMLKWAESDTMDSVAVAFSCLKLYDLMQSDQAKISVLLTSVSYFLQAIQKSESLADKYAYRNAIMKMGKICTTTAKTVATPFFQTLIFQSIFAMVMSANQLVSLHLTHQPNKSIRNEKIKIYLISEKKSERIAHDLRSIVALGKVNPFINLEHIGLIDTCKINIVGKSIMQEFFMKKTSVDNFESNLLPKHLYSYWKMIGVWQNWIKDESVVFQNVRYNCIRDLLKYKGLTMRQAEKVLEWPLISTNSDGWLNLHKSELNLSPTMSFSGVGGFSFCMETGEFNLLLKPCSSISQALFTAEDILEVCQCGIDLAFFTLVDCLEKEPLMEYTPLASGVYTPKILKNTSFLKTMMKVDILLKELVTGVELNIKSPFLLRKASEGILQRLPAQLKKEIEDFYERRLGKKNDCGVSVYRFYLEMANDTKLDYEQNKSEIIFKIGNINPVVKRHLMVQNDSGKYVDANPNDDNRNSVEQKFAKFLTDNYDEIGRYFPELLRLKQLQKIAILYRFLKKHLLVFKNSKEKADKKICASIKKLGIKETDEDSLRNPEEAEECFWVPTLFFGETGESSSSKNAVHDMKIFGGISMQSATHPGKVVLSKLYKPYTVNSLKVFAQCTKESRRHEGGEQLSIDDVEEQESGLETAAKRVLKKICSRK